MTRKTFSAIAFSLAAPSFAFAAGVVASNADLAAIKTSMEDRLKDSDSAKFKDVRISKDGTTCGLVNAKNSYGAYSGFEPFLAMKLSSGRFYIVDISKEAGQVCAGKGI